MLKLGR